MLLVVVVVAFVLVSLWRVPVTERLDTTDELAEQAGQIVAEVFTAQAQTWRSDRARAREQVTPQLAASAASGLSDAPPAGVRSVRWEPLSVGVVDAHRDWGTALVVANVVVTTSDGRQRTETKSVSVDLVRSGDRWLLSGLDELQ